LVIPFLQRNADNKNLQVYDLYLSLSRQPSIFLLAIVHIYLVWVMYNLLAHFEMAHISY